MAIEQEGRLLSLSTPLAENFLLPGLISVHEGLSELFEIKLDLVHEESDEGRKPTVVDAQKLLGQPMAIRVHQKDGTERHFNGMCVEFVQGNRDNRYSYYQARLAPHVWELTQVHQSRIFQNISVPDVLKKVLEGYQVDYEIMGTFEPRNYCVQYRESDWDFASRLMEEEGIFYFFKHSEDTHRLVIANTPQSHPDCPSKSQLPFYDISELGEFREGKVLTWGMESRLRTGKYTVWDYNFELPTSHLEAERTSRYDFGGNQNLEFYDYPGGYAKRFDGVNQGGGDQSGNLQKVFEDMRRVVALRQQELDAGYKTNVGTADCCALTAGHKFTLSTHPNAEVNASYVLTSVDVEMVQSPAYASSDEITGDPVQINFVCIPLSVPFRPDRRTPKPIVRGTQTAAVVGPSGEEIFVDKYGRVKVQFHWDREGKNDASSSCWIRVGTHIGGKKWGTMFIPRIGQEVIVDFIDGDPDEPIIVGSVYNFETMPHYELPKFKTLTYIKTRTSPDDGKGYNELRFEDKANKEQVFIRSQLRYDLRVRGSMYETCGGSRHELIGLKQENQPGGNLAVTVAGNYDLHVKEAHFIGIDSKVNETVKSDVVEDFQGKQYTQVQGKRELNAQEITLEALSKITFKVGGTFISLDLSGVTVSGPMVKINSGGAGMGTSPSDIEDPLDAEISDNGEPGNLDKPHTGGGKGGRKKRTLKGQHAPPFQTKTLPNGDIQVGNHMIIKKDPADPTFQDKVLRDMTTMSNHPTGMNTLNSINNGANDTTIQHTTGGNATNYTNPNDAAAKGKPDLNGNPGTGKGTGSTIDYNPDREPPTAADPTKKRPADVGLNHEMVHAVHGTQGTDDNSPDPANPNNPTVEETETINKDNDYRKERGVPTRRDHTVL